jgi:hypothetical protein
MPHLLRWPLLLAVVALGFPIARTFGEDEETSASISGEVVSAKGAAVAGIAVTARRDGWLVGETTTNELGRFTLRVVGGGACDLAVADRTDGTTPVVWEGEAPGVALGTRDVRIVVGSTPADRVLRIRVESPDGPVAGVEVSLHPRPIGGGGHQRTDSSGSARFEGLTPKAVTVRVARQRPWTPAQVANARPGGAVLEVAVESVRALVGTVVDEAEHPAVGVGVRPDSTAGSVAGPIADITDVTGAFRVGVPSSWSTAAIRAGLSDPRGPSLGGVVVRLAWAPGHEPKPARITMPAPAGAPAATPEDVAAIYRLVLEQKYRKEGTKRVVLLDPLDTRIAPLMGAEVHAYTTPGRGLDSLRKRMHESTWPAFVDAVLALPPTPRDVETSVPVHVISRRWWYAFRRDEGDEAWHRYYEKFPGSEGVIDFSPIGFSEGGTQAFVHVSRFFGFLAANGMAFLLEKTEQGWTIVGETTTWVS